MAFRFKLILAREERTKSDLKEVKDHEEVVCFNYCGLVLGTVVIYNLKRKK
jgi:hypothetical protein